MNNIIRYSQISPEFIKNEMISRYNFNNDICCSFYRMGMNDIYLISNTNEKYYLRLSLAGMHEYTDYNEEAHIIDSLSQNGISVALPIKCNDSNFVWTVNAPEGRRYAILFAEAKNQPSQDIEKSLYNLGAMIAKMHLTADEKNYKISRKPIDFEQLVYEPVNLIKKHLANRTDDYEFIEKAMNNLGKLIADTLPIEKPYYGFCHGDIHLSNVNFENEKPVIFDFDCMGNGWRSHDLSVFLFNHSLSNENYRDSNQWKEFLNGYNSVRKFDENEVKLLPAFCALRSIWVIGVHTKLSEINSGSQMFSNGYFDFFINNFKLWYNRSFE